jgi:hypothetical protein
VFRDSGETHVVYKHHDGYPSGAIQWIAAARALAWPFPRFEADEFGAAFIAANKNGPGSVRLVGQGNWQDLAPGDIEYVYVIHLGMVEALAVENDYRTGKWTTTRLFSHPLQDIENAEVEA